MLSVSSPNCRLCCLIDTQDVAVKSLIVNTMTGVPQTNGVTPLERAIQEAAVCTSLVHPNIVSPF